MLLAREQDIPVVYIAAWFQDFPITVVTKADSSIESIEDLAGKQVGLPDLLGASYISLRALLDQAGIDEANLTLDSIGFNQVAALATDREDAVVGYFSNEPIQLRAQGELGSGSCRAHPRASASHLLNLLWFLNTPVEPLCAGCPVCNRGGWFVPA